MVNLFFPKTLIYLFIFSFVFNDRLKINLINILNITISEIIFISLLIFCILKYKFDFFKFQLDYKNYSKIELVIYVIFFVKLIKYFLNVESSINIFELNAWIYMILIYNLFKYLLNNNKIELKIIERSFIYLLYISSTIIIVSYIAYFFHLGEFENFFLWEIKELQYPYFGKNSLHISGLLDHYNMQAYILIPGIFFLIKENLNVKIYKLLLIFLFTIFVLYLIKSKIILIGFSFLIFFILSEKFSKMINSKIMFLFIAYFSLTALVYFMITHFLIVDKGFINSNNINEYLLYYTRTPLISYENYEVFGSLFFKLKLVAFELARTNNFIFFNELHFLEYNMYQEETMQKFYEISQSDPHSTYLGMLSNYGLITLLLFCSFLFYNLKNLNSLGLKNVYKISNNCLILILAVFLIEAINSDIEHFRFLWIILAQLYFINAKNLKVK